MSRGIPTKLIGAILGLAGFAIAIVVGIAVENEATTTLVRALVALVACNAVGLLIGAACERVVHDHITSYQHANPVDDAGPTVFAGPVEDDDGVLVV